MIKKIVFISALFVVVYGITTMVIRSWPDIFVRKYIDTIPFETYGNAIIIPVVIGGKTYHFQFDTGASTIVSKELFSEFGLTVKDSIESRDYYGNKNKIAISILPDLTISKTKFNNVKVAVMRPIQPFLSCGIKIDGYLGNDILSKGVVQIDIRNKQLIIANSIINPSIAMDGHNSIDFEMDNQMKPYLLIKFPGTDTDDKVLFDTGSGNYFYRLDKMVFLKMVKNGRIKNKDILDTLGSSKNGRGMFGKQNEQEIFFVNFDSIDFVGKTIYNCPSYTYSSGYCSILGGPFLHLGVVTIDYTNHKFYFRPYHQNKIDLRPKNGFTMTGDRRGQFIVETVLDGSAAQKKGIKKGFVLKKLNSLYFDSLSLCERFKINWVGEYNRDTVEYVFLIKGDKLLNVNIKN